MAEIFLSIGSNIERERHLRAVHAALEDSFGDLTLSSVYETAAVGFDGDDFYNMVIALQSQQPVASLLEQLHRIEILCGRLRSSERFSPRTMDIDLLLYDDLIVDEKELQLPRHEILHYAFVLAPLAEVAGERCHPQNGLSYSQLWQDFRGDKTGLKKVDFNWTTAKGESD